MFNTQGKLPTRATSINHQHQTSYKSKETIMASASGNPVHSLASNDSSSTSSNNNNNNKALNDEQIYQWISELVTGNNRERALLELGKKREQYDDLALVLWNSFGVITVLLEEIISVYPYLNPPNLSASISNRVCNALALLQCVASNVQTRTLFLNANLPLYLYPFLSTNARQRSFEYLRLTSLGVIGALVKNDTPEVINFLLTTEIVPLCLNIMEISSELSKTVAIFILQKILLDDQGLAYVCTTFERFHTVASVLSKMIDQLSIAVNTSNAQQQQQQSVSSSSSSNSSGRLLKHVVRCYMRLSDNLEARKALANILPEPLRDGTFSTILQDDLATKRCLSQLLSNINEPQ
ncbi:CCR4/NOT1 complex homologue conserved subunit, putative [Candida dubliniensis CD36]|uniref:Cellular differentiation regulator, putative n=1 Tax=Candida dubliniensis (strain CD36 / ATCC MYA-646 / CBS 7987 / NCPF 3949 / NRRL Y-17841) TaxID=573826 RepID=B9WJU4_CANDC|nr:CCR4/NOT1 complex homologue conserved subunit, putative [Candida dubliniensis CD36]CAX40902.1 CCR4/NOT1 complex homologue conserved subunit, putative [Candida dubliniensis CD36]